MTEQELDRLAALIAAALVTPSVAPSPSRPAQAAGTWLPVPVRPEPSARGNEAPVWSGGAQSLGDIAPGGGEASMHRVTTAALTNATRAAAAGRGRPPERPVAGRGPTGRTPGITRPRASNAPAIDVPVGVSNRHIHLSPADFRTLFGKSEPTVHRAITQPGQFAAAETLNVIGPRGRIDGVRVVGPVRGETQLEISLADARRLGLEPPPPIAASGALTNSSGGVTLVGAMGEVKLARGVIVAARHLHLGAADAARWGLRDGDRLDVRCGTGPRATTFHDVLVRAGAQYATEFHLDADEAHAAQVKSGDRATILAWRAGAAARRSLVTERDVIELARSGGALPAGAILTPSARDRARSLRLLDA